MGFWAVTGLLAFSLVATLAARWLVTRRGAAPASAGSISAIISDLLWCLLIFASGLIATRYIERTDNKALGYLVFGCVAVVLCLVRSLLLTRARQQQEPGAEKDVRVLLQNGIPTVNYLLLSAALYLVSSLFVEAPADPLLFVPTFIGALLPDLDSRSSLMGRLFPPVSRRLESSLGHLQEMHSLGANTFLALITAPLILLIGWYAWLMISVGYLSHLALDMLHPEGIMLFWPLRRTRYFVSGSLAGSRRGNAELVLSAALATITIVLFAVADVGTPEPPPMVAPSFESTYARYLSLRGRYLALADVNGTWQATGRRVSARFEILNAVDGSFILMDGYSGWIFTAGRSSSDNLYLNDISVTAGSPVRVKPVEIELYGQRLAELLPVIYEMQREPGLQHIFVSGELIAQAGQDPQTPGASLQVEHSQTQLPRIQSMGERHFRLQYLNAVDVIGLANVSVEMASLVVVATYVSPASGPTATPLPSPPALSERAP